MRRVQNFIWPQLPLKKENHNKCLEWHTRWMHFKYSSKEILPILRWSNKFQDLLQFLTNKLKIFPSINYIWISISSKNLWMKSLSLVKSWIRFWIRIIPIRIWIRILPSNRWCSSSNKKISMTYRMECLVLIIHSFSMNSRDSKLIRFVMTNSSSMILKSDHFEILKFFPHQGKFIINYSFIRMKYQFSN